MALLPLNSVFSQNNSQHLPNIGDPAASVLPLSKEQNLGRIFVREIRSKLPLVSDLEVNEYLNALGTQLANQSHSPLKFYFLLADSPSVNAFATLGGVITINSGLLILMDNESQLAGVMAHEIAHVTQRHLARFLAASDRLNWTSALALLSVILATTYDADLGQLGLHASITAPLERQLSYLRAHEREADNTGMQIMASSGINPNSVPDVFQHLHDQSSSASQVPEFLRTHPFTLDRLNDAINRLSRYRHGTYRTDSEEFQYTKARLHAMTSPKDVLRERTSDDTIYLYKRAVALMQLHRTQEALDILKKINRPESNLSIKLALAQVYIRHGDYNHARDLLQQLNTVYTNRETISYYYALSLLKLGQADKASQVLSPITIRKHHHPLIYKLYAEIAQRQNKPWVSHEYLADYYEANGKLNTALNHLQQALATNPDNKIFTARAKEKQQQINALKEEARNPLQ